MLPANNAGTAMLIRADARTLPVADCSVDLIVTSPPYFALRSYQDGGEHYDGQIGAEATPGEFIDALIAATREMVRVLKPSGSIFVNLGDKYNGTKSLLGVPWRYAIRCIDELGLILRAEIIWAKPNGLPESVTDRVTRKHEQWFHFTVSERYYSNIDAIREPFRPSSLSRARYAQNTTAKARMTMPGERREKANQSWSPSTLGKIPSSVWDVATEPLRVDPALGVDHFAAFPTEWPRRLILGWSPENGTVLDPFGGTGTTAAVAKALGRTGINVDLSADYLRLADWRCNGAGYDNVCKKIRKHAHAHQRRIAPQLTMEFQ